MSERVEIIDGTTGEILGAPRRADVRRRVDSLAKAFALGAKMAMGTVEEAATVRFSCGGRHMDARWSKDCARPRRLDAEERGSAAGGPSRSAFLVVRCGGCAPCKEARARERMHRSRVEMLRGGFMGEAIGAEAGRGHLAEGCRTWFVSPTFAPAVGRPLVRAVAARLRAEATARRDAALDAEIQAAVGAGSSDPTGRGLKALFRPGDVRQRKRGGAEAAKAEEARDRRHGLVHDTEADAERFWLFRAAHWIGAQYVRRLRRSRPRSEGQVPLKVVIAVEPHKKDGFPHLHLLLHEQGVPLRKDAIVRCWSRRRDGAPAGGVDPHEALLPLGSMEARLVGGDKVKAGKLVRQGPDALKKAAAYCGKYCAKDGALWRASKGYGVIDPEAMARNAAVSADTRAEVARAVEELTAVQADMAAFDAVMDALDTPEGARIKDRLNLGCARVAEAMRRPVQKGGSSSSSDPPGAASSSR